MTTTKHLLAAVVALGAFAYASSASAAGTDEVACGDGAIQIAQIQFERNGDHAQLQAAVREAVAKCPKGKNIVMVRMFVGTHCDLSKAVVDTGYNRVACVKQ